MLIKGDEMQQLKTLIHSGININQGTHFTRITARAIVIKYYLCTQIVMKIIAYLAVV